MDISPANTRDAFSEPGGSNGHLYQRRVPVPSPPRRQQARQPPTLNPNIFLSGFRCGSGARREFCQPGLAPKVQTHDGGRTPRTACRRDEGVMSIHSARKACVLRSWKLLIIHAINIE